LVHLGEVSFQFIDRFLCLFILILHVRISFGGLLLHLFLVVQVLVVEVFNLLSVFVQFVLIDVICVTINVAFVLAVVATCTLVTIIVLAFFLICGGLRFLRFPVFSLNFFIREGRFIGR